jgi:hypothetical protein
VSQAKRKLHSMSDKPTDTPRYELDEDTQELVELVMTWAQQSIDNQYEEETKADMQTILMELADRFDIQTHNIAYTETYDETTGETTVKIRVENNTKTDDDTAKGEDGNIVPFPGKPKGTIH